MEKIKVTQGDLVVRDARIVIVAARFNEFVVESLVKGALDCLRRHGAADADIDIVRVPGAYEMPLVVDRIAGSRRADGIVALGAVIGGGTPHFDYEADTIEQAIERAGTKAGNKGEEAALAVIEMINLLRRLD